MYDSLERACDQPAVAPLRSEVRAHTATDVARLADVQRRAFAVAHDVHTWRLRQVLGQRKLVRVPGPATLTEPHGTFQRRVAALGEQVEQQHQDFGRCLGVR